MRLVDDFHPMKAFDLTASWRAVTMQMADGSAASAGGTVLQDAATMAWAESFCSIGGDWHVQRVL